MVHLELFGRDEPVLIVQSDGIDAKEIEEWYAEYPAVFEEVTYRQHTQRHVDV